MLDIIRKKASKWGTKVIFGIIIIVFALFFGYNRMSQRVRGGGDVAARVNGEIISRPLFQMAYDNTYKMYQNVFKGSEGEGLPAGIEKGIKSTALRELIQQAVVQQLGNDLGLAPTELEIADAIRASDVAKGEDGKFDPYFYKHRFLPYFLQKYGISYEELIKNDILVKKVQDVFASVGKAPLARNLYELEHTKWTFEVAEYDSEDDAKSKKGGRIKKVGPITISQRDQLFSTAVDVSVWERVFSGPSGPIKGKEKWYTAKPIKVERPKDADWEKGRDDYVKTAAEQSKQEVFQSWLSSLLKTAKIKTFIEE